MNNPNEAKYDLGAKFEENKVLPPQVDVRMTPWQARKLAKLHSELATMYRLIGQKQVADAHMATVDSLKALLAQVPKGK